MGIVYVIDLTLNGTITNQVEITTHYDKVINYATFTNTGTSIAVVVALETSSTMAIHIHSRHQILTVVIQIYTIMAISRAAQMVTLRLSGAIIIIQAFHLKINQDWATFSN